MGGLDSDEEIERDAMSDASDSDEPSLIDSASDSEAESDAGSLARRNGRTHPDTPSTTQSPPPGETVAALNGFAVSVSKPDPHGDALQPPRSAPAFLSAGADWSDMVTDEGVNGAASLPVIDFADLHDGPPLLTKQDDVSGSVASDDGAEEEREDAASSQQGTERPARGGHANRRGAPRPVGASARQAYQSRLQNDPSFVPTVGEFWGHDDRLMQKDLRSLSGWWRGRWQGRGRARGGFIGRGMRGRGRGGYFGGAAPAEGEGEAEAEAAEALTPEPEVPPTEKAWTHDGFEEMKAKDDRRRATEKRTSTKPYNRPAAPNGGSVPSRGGFAPRGRGTAPRAANSPTYARGGKQQIMHHLRSQPDRPWFAMKPEHGWTKQHEGYLYIDPSLKPKHGKPAGFRVSLPGKGSEVVRAPPAPRKAAEETQGPRSQAPSETAGSTDVGSRTFVIRMPKKVVKKEAPQVGFVQPEPEPFTTREDVPEDETQTAPVVVAPPAVQPPVANAEPPVHVAAPPQQPDTLPAPTNVMATPSLTRDSSMSERSVADVHGITAQVAELNMGDDKLAPEFAPAGPMPPVQTAFSHPAEPTPTYATSPYAYPPSLPPGIALNQQGFAYEVASGRPVYVHPTPPPAPMHIFNPRPIPFVPGHMHHHSLSSDYMPPPSTPPINGIVDPSTGQPIFSLPRQNSRIEIRAPSDGGDGQSRAKQERRPSNLRSTTVAEENGGVQQPPLAPAPHGMARFASAPEFYPPEMMGGMMPRPNYQPSEGAMSMSPGSEEPPMDPSMMGYPPYQQQYYYPEQYYPAYAEMPQQHDQYNPYGVDPRQQQPTYY